MVTMIDEIYDRHYQAARADLNAGIAGAVSGIAHTIGDSLKVLHRMEWGAPWTPSKKTNRRA